MAGWLDGCLLPAWVAGWPCNYSVACTAVALDLVDADITDLRRQQDMEYANALAEDLARQRLTEQEVEDTVDMNAVRVARITRFALASVNELPPNSLTDNQSCQPNRQLSRQRRRRQRQRGVPSGTNNVPLGTRRDASIIAAQRFLREMQHTLR